MLLHKLSSSSRCALKAHSGAKVTRPRTAATQRPKVWPDYEAACLESIGACWQAVRQRFAKIFR